MVTLSAYERYPWDEWTDGKEHTYSPPYVSIQTFRTYLYARAKQLGMTVSAVADGNTIHFRFFADRADYVANKLKRSNTASTRTHSGQFYSHADTAGLPRCRHCDALLSAVAQGMGECGRWSGGGIDGTWLPKHEQLAH